MLYLNPKPYMLCGHMDPQTLRVRANLTGPLGSRGVFWFTKGSI